MMMKPIVNIIVPVFNADKYLVQCIESLIHQTYPNIRIILVNDGSTDTSKQICDQYATKDFRILVLHQENQGSVSARRNGVMACDDEGYICFCDADDKMAVTAIDKLVSNMKDANSICVAQQGRLYRNFSVKSRKTAPCFRINEPVVYSHDAFISNLYCSWFGISNVPVSLCAKLFPASLLKQVYTHTPNVVHFLGDDLIITAAIFPLADSITVIPDTVYYCRPGGNTSRFAPYMMDDWVALYNYKRVLAQKYHMPQDTELLMDIELCNMAFTYFLMLEKSQRLPSSEVRELIINTCGRKEVTQAANNPRLERNFEKGVLLREKNIDAIYLKIKEQTKRLRLKNIAKRIIYKFV